VAVPSLLDPVFGDSPCGKDVRSMSSGQTAYFSLRDERFNARNLEKKLSLEGNFEISLSSWQKIYDLSLQILQKESKDLQVACWLIEALVRLRGFDGLAEGLQIVRGLIESYWSTLYPESDGEIPDAKIASFIGLNGDSTEGSLIFPIFNVPITEGKTVEDYPTWKIINLQKDPDKESLLKSIQETSKDFFLDVYDSIQRCLEEIRLLEDVLIEKMQKEAPSFLITKNTLEKCLDTLKSIAGSLISEKTSDKNINTSQEGKSQSVNLPQTGITDRNNAFHTLQEIATFFERTEPQSFLPHLIRKAVRWGEMPLSQLLTELVGDSGTLKSIFSLSGIETDDV
jgi:type VI secretion system protein ImpA